ncbi:MAG: hypothetical protein GEU73_01750 [Chloroflexi bacterium]|nr:hypothetical protein [Chloroflexota bacterium]
MPDPPAKRFQHKKDVPMKRTLIGSLVFVMFVAPCGPQDGGSVGTAGSEGPTESKRITVGLPGPGADVRGTGSEDTDELVLSALVRFDASGEPAAHLAEALPTRENGLWKIFPDGRMETTVAIREGARWHDGTPFAAVDAVFGVSVGKMYPHSNFGSAAFELIESVDPIDDRTIVITWNSLYPQANWLFSNIFAPPLPRHLLKEPFSDDPVSFIDLRYWTTEFVGNGPFIVTEFVPGTHMLLKAFDGYVLGRPKIDEIELRYIPEVNTLMANLLADEVDLTVGSGLSIDQALRVKDSWADGEVIYSPNFQTQAVAYPQFYEPDPSILLDVRLRRALAHAIDRDEILQSVQAGVGAVASSLPAPTGPGFGSIKDRIVEYPYDPQRAAQLIADLGFTRGSDGLFRDAANRELQVQAWTAGGSDTYERTTLAIVDYWRRVGVAAAPNIIPSTADDSVMASRPGFQMAALRTELDTRFLSSRTPLPENNFRGSNRARYMNPELDTFIDRYFQMLPGSERDAVLGDVVRHLTENVVVIHLFYNVVPQMKHQRLKNVEPRSVRSPIPNAHLWELG